MNLLCGRLPYDVSREVYEAARTIREQDPAPLGTVCPKCRGDLEIIVSKALAKDKMRRYASAAELAIDLRRFLNAEPILARAADRELSAQEVLGSAKRTGWGRNDDFSRYGGRFEIARKKYNWHCWLFWKKY
jgi:hypothetical protein